MTFEIRAYEPTDERSWLRCRALSFLDTCYYDDVWTKRPATSVVQLVAVYGSTVVGILDVEVNQKLATIDTVATHPDYQGRRIASRLLARVRADLPDRITTLDAWTREDEPALAWYRAHGFKESDNYLHVYKGWEEPDEGWESPPRLTAPITAFCHASIEDEADMRGRFSRVYVCRRFSQTITQEPARHQAGSP